MKAAQITQYSKNIHITVNDIPIPEIGDYDILIRIKAVAVNPVDILFRSVKSELLRSMWQSMKMRQRICLMTLILQLRWRFP